VTCIIATPRFMCGDRRVIDGGLTSTMTKLCASRALIVGVSGYAADVMAVRRALRAGAETPSDLIEAISVGSYALVLQPSGAVSTIQDGEVWSQPRGAPAAIGTGSDMALGYLAGAGGEATIDLARRAQRWVAKKRNDCGGGVDIRFFKS